jgi:uncharacterized protein (DUF58 family)
LSSAPRPYAALEDPDLFMAMDDLELVARGVVEGALHGLHRSPYLGFSAEFDAHREYQPGDDLRHVNWNLWARTDRLYVKQFKSDTNLNLYLLLDCSGSMACAHGPAPKWRYGARAVAALAYLALLARDAPGVFLIGGGVRDQVPPKVRPGQLREIAALLDQAPVHGQSSLALELDEVMQLCRRRGIVVLVSDLFDDVDAVFRGLNNLRFYGHEVMLLQVLDPWEAHLPERGQYEFRDLETDERLRTDAAAVREGVHRDVTAWQQDLQRRCVEAGFDWLTTTTRDPLGEVLINYLLRRSGMT